MGGPWEDYAQPSSTEGEGPWNDYSTPESVSPEITPAKAETSQYEEAHPFREAALGALQGTSAVATGLEKAGAMAIRAGAGKLGMTDAENWANKRLGEIRDYEQKFVEPGPQFSDIHNVPTAVNWAAGQVGRLAPIAAEYATVGVPGMVMQGAMTGAANAAEQTDGNVASTITGGAIEGVLNGIPGHIIMGSAGRPFFQAAARGAVGMGATNVAGAYANAIPLAIENGKYVAPTGHEVLEAGAAGALGGGLFGGAGAMGKKHGEISPKGEERPATENTNEDVAAEPAPAAPEEAPSDISPKHAIQYDDATHTYKIVDPEGKVVAEDYLDKYDAQETASALDGRLPKAEPKGPIPEPEEGLRQLEEIGGVKRDEPPVEDYSDYYGGNTDRDLYDEHLLREADEARAMPEEHVTEEAPREEAPREEAPREEVKSEPTVEEKSYLPQEVIDRYAGPVDYEINRLGIKVPEEARLKSIRQLAEMHNPREPVPPKQIDPWGGGKPTDRFPAPGGKPPVWNKKFFASLREKLPEDLKRRVSYTSDTLHVNNPTHAEAGTIRKTMERMMQTSVKKSERARARMEGQPSNILHAIRQWGGIRNDGGAEKISNLGVQGAPPGFINNRVEVEGGRGKGISHEQALEKAIENGWIVDKGRDEHGVSQNDLEELYDLIRNKAANPHYEAKETTESARLDDIREEAYKRGIEYGEHETFDDIAAKLNENALPERLAMDSSEKTGEFVSDIKKFDKFLSDKGASSPEATHTAIRDYLMSEGTKTNTEHAVFYDAKSGKILEVGTSNRYGEVDIPESMGKALVKRGNKIDVHHNHPEELPLSVDDIAAGLSGAGARSVVAHTHNGEISKASLTQSMADKLHASDFRNGYKMLTVVASKAKSGVARALDLAVKRGDISKELSDKVLSEITNMSLARAGVINYETSHTLVKRLREHELGKVIFDAALKHGTMMAKSFVDTFGGGKHEIKARNDSGWSEGTRSVRPEEGMESLRLGATSARGKAEKTGTVSPEHEDKNGVSQKGVGEGAKLKQPTKEAEEKREGVFKTLRNAIAPTLASEGAGRFAGKLREYYGIAKRNSVKADSMMEESAKLAETMTPEQHADFYNFIEGRSNGAKLKDPTFLGMADTIREVMKNVREHIEAQPEYAKMNFVKDYMRHSFKHTPRLDSFFKDFYAKQGSMSALKERKIPTIAEALAYGLELKEPNPVRATAQYVASMENHLASVKALRYLTDVVGARYFARGMEPEGWSPLVGNNAERIQNARVDPISQKLFPAHTRQLFAKDDVATIYNRWYSKGLESTKFKDAYETLRNATNANTLMELGLSAYHAMTITFQSVNQDLGRIMKNAAVGDWEGVVKAAKGLATPRLGVGKKIVNQYKGKADYGGEIARIADEYTKGNNRTHNDPLSNVGRGGFFTLKERGELPAEIKRLKDQMKEGKGLGALKTAAEVTGMVVRTVSDPLFNYYIPAVKASAFGDLMGDWIRQNPTASEPQLNAARVRISNMIDDRFGEMNQDNLFWNRIAKQVTGLAIRAPGWDLGLIRQVGGPAYDIYRMVSDAKQGKKFDPINLDRSLYMLGATMVYATANSAMTYLKTGIPPSEQELKDFVNYRTGGIKKSFRKWVDERGVLPGHFKEIMNLWPVPGEGALSGLTEEVKNKIATFPKNVYQTIMNKNWKDEEIAPHNPQDWTEYPGVAHAAHIAKGFIPFTLGALANPAAGSEMNLAERVLGVRPGGARVVNPEGLEKFKTMDKKHAKKGPS